MMRSWRVVVFAAVCLGAIGAAALAIAAGGNPQVDAGGTSATAAPEALRATTGQPHVVFRDTAPGAGYGRLGLASLADPGRRLDSGLACERVDMHRSGVCVRADRGALTSYTAVIFDAAFQPIWEAPLSGTPSRAQVSPDGRYASVTTFVSGDSYAAASFSTRTVLLDIASRQPLADLEQFTVHKDGEQISAVDFNFWGVTFAADSNHFFATLGTGGHTYLVEGDIARREVTVRRDGVECPSLSPDGRQIAFKKRVTEGLGVQWRLSVLDVATMQDHPLAETRTVDDQAEWLDDATVLYGLPRAGGGGSSDTWAVPADGTGQPRVLLPDAWSPGVDR